MTLRVLLFDTLRQSLGTEVTAEVPVGATGTDLLDQLAADHPVDRRAPADDPAGRQPPLRPTGDGAGAGRRGRADHARQRRVTRAATLLLLVCAAPASAQLRWQVRDAEPAVEVAATAKAGTHENTVGLRLATGVGVPLGAREHGVVIRAGAGAEALAQDLGISGAALGAQADLSIGYAFGERHRQRGAETRPPRRHELAYALVGYLDADSTSQLSGALRYRHTREAWSLDVQFENDALAQQLLDRYRTFALRVQLLRRDTAVPVGVGLRTVVWTGTTQGLGRLGRDEAYDLSGQYGGDRSHGILALDLVRGDLTLSVGIDSEAVRSTLQNSFHYVIDDGQIPRLDRPGRVFVRIALGEAGGLY